MSVVTLTIQGDAKLLQQLKSCFKKTIKWSKYQIKVSTEGVNKYLDFLIDPSFQGIDRLFVLSFENEMKNQQVKEMIKELVVC